MPDVPDVHLHQPGRKCRRPAAAAPRPAPRRPPAGLGALGERSICRCDSSSSGTATAERGPAVDARPVPTDSRADPPQLRARRASRSAVDLAEPVVVRPPQPTRRRRATSSAGRRALERRRSQRDQASNAAAADSPARAAGRAAGGLASTADQRSAGSTRPRRAPRRAASIRPSPQGATRARRGRGPTPTAARAARARRLMSAYAATRTAATIRCSPAPSARMAPPSGSRGGPAPGRDRRRPRYSRSPPQPSPAGFATPSEAARCRARTHAGDVWTRPEPGRPPSPFASDGEGPRSPPTGSSVDRIEHPAPASSECACCRAPRLSCACSRHG